MHQGRSTAKPLSPLAYALCFAAAAVSSTALAGMIRVGEPTGTQGAANAVAAAKEAARMTAEAAGKIGNIGTVSGGPLGGVAGGLTGLLIFAVVLYCMIRVVRGSLAGMIDRRTHWFAGPIAALLSGCLTIGRNLYLTDMGGWTSAGTWTGMILAIPGLWAIVAVAIDRLTGAASRIASAEAGTAAAAANQATTKQAITNQTAAARTATARWLAAYRTIGTGKLLIALWIVILAVWLIGFLGAFPGIYGYDAIYQVRMYYLGGGNVNNHHPIVHTYLLGWCVVTIGERLLGSAAAGLAVYCVLQMLAMSLIYAYISARLNRLSGPVASLISAAFFAFVPYHMILAFSATKDSLFAAFFALGVFQTYAIARRIQADRHAFIPVATWVGYGCVLFAGCLLRNNALYAIVVLLAFAAILLRSQWRGFLTTLLAIVVAWGLFTGPVYRVLNVQKEGAAAMLSVPAQQLARAALLNADEIGAEDMRQIKEYMPTVETYQARISDHVVFPFNNAKYAEDKGAFYRLWARVGKAAPGTYLDAFLLLNAGNWYPDMGYPVPDGYHPYLEYGFPGNEDAYNAHKDDPDGDSWIFVPMQPKSQWVSEQLNGFARGDWQTVPGAVLLCNPGAYIWLILIAAAVMMRRRRYVMLLPLALMTLYWGTLLLAPTILFRYSYALAAALPVLVGLVCGDSGRSGTETGGKRADDRLGGSSHGERL